MSGQTDGKNQSGTACEAFSPISPGLSPGLSAGHVRLLNLLSHEIASALSAAAENVFPGKAVVSPLPVTAGPRSALSELPGIGIAFAATPYPFQGKLYLDRTLAYGLLEHSLGGDRLAPPPDRAFSVLERLLLVRMITPLLEACEQGWRRFAPVRFTGLEAEEAATRSKRDALGCLCPFQVSADTVAGALTLCLPLPEADPLLARLTVEAWVSGGSTGSSERQLLAALQDSRVSVRAVLGARSLAFGEFSRLAAGDLVFLPGLNEDAVTVHIADRPKFLGKVRHHRGRLVVELIEHP